MKTLKVATPWRSNWNNDRTSESSWNTGIDLKKEAILFSWFEGTTPDTAGYNSVVE